ncbi:MAG: hypothetical protein HY815_14395 [Candidatus Riflebacteria bacterium]|nr:hypothetical protein [Candidatus Riflebacteria bacterium]
MDRFVAQRKTIRQSRRDLLSRLSAACARNASGSELSSLLGEWDALGARASDVTRAQLAAARKLLTADETVRLALNAKQRIDRVLKMVALIGRFHPVD